MRGHAGVGEQCGSGMAKGAPSKARGRPRSVRKPANELAKRVMEAAKAHDPGPKRPRTAGRAVSSQRSTRVAGAATLARLVAKRTGLEVSARTVQRVQAEELGGRRAVVRNIKTARKRRLARQRMVEQLLYGDLWR